jgi:hypothetical protein
LEGTRADVTSYGSGWEVIVRRALFDERPGRPLVGRRTDAAASPQWEQQG